MVTESKANRVKTTRLVKAMVDAHYEHASRAKEEGRLFGWLIGPPPYTMLHAMDIDYVHLENYAAKLVARNIASEMREASESEGFPIDMCSYARITHGALALSAENTAQTIADQLRLPPPDFLYVSPCCQTMTYWYESFARLLDVPCFYLDIPDTYHDSQFTRNVEYVRSQLEDFIKFLEDISGRSFNWERLTNYLELVKEGTILKKQCFDLCRHVPSPMSQFDWSISLAPTNNLRGSPEAVEYFKTLKNELADRVANNIGAVKNERFRLYWDHIHIWYKLRYLSEWFAEHDACVVASNYTQDGFFYHPEDIDPAKPLETFALEQSRVGMIRNLDYHINLVSQYVEDYKLDGLVMHACRTCRSMELGQFDVVDAISKKYGIPGIVIEGDHCDPTLFSESLWNDRLEAFLETVAVAKSTR